MLSGQDDVCSQPRDDVLGLGKSRAKTRVEPKRARLDRAKPSRARGSGEANIFLARVRNFFWVSIQWLGSDPQKKDLKRRAAWTVTGSQHETTRTAQYQAAIGLGMIGCESDLPMLMIRSRKIES